MENINMSVIIPVYNVEEYLSACIDSVMCQGDLRFEVILIDDGSTDRSGDIADKYAKRDNRVKVIHQENRGASAARNTGLDLAKGEYIVFIDSDDWVKEGSLYELYCEAIMYQSDIVMGNMWYCSPDGNKYSPFNPVPNDIRTISLSGKELFIRLSKAGAYPPMAFNYLFRRSYLEKIQIRFEEGIMHEDELWSPVVICQTKAAVTVDIDFYYYRQREGSVMKSTGTTKRMDSLFRVTERLIKFADRYDFSGVDGDLKNWLYVTVFRLYSWAFGLLPKIKDSTYIIPANHLDRFWRDCWEMQPEPQKICNRYYRIAENGLKKHVEWRASEWVASVAPQINAGKKTILLYNTVWGEALPLRMDNVPPGWIITTDRHYLKQVYAVVFHIPGLYHELESDLEKPEGQVWIAVDSENQHTLKNDPEFRDIFDMWIYYRKDEEKKENPFIHLFSEIFAMCKQQTIDFNPILKPSADNEHCPQIKENPNKIEPDDSSGKRVESILL